MQVIKMTDYSCYQLVLVTRPTTTIFLFQQKSNQMGGFTRKAPLWRRPYERQQGICQGYGVTTTKQGTVSSIKQSFVVTLVETGSQTVQGSQWGRGSVLHLSNSLHSKDYVVAPSNTTRRFAKQLQVVRSDSLHCA